VDLHALGTGVSVIATLTGTVIALAVVGALAWDCYRHPIGKVDPVPPRHRRSRPPVGRLGVGGSALTRLPD